MTVEWNRTVTEIVWESQTAPGITWTTVVGGTSSGGGVTVHNDLSGRSAADAHPMSAITDLEPALTDIATAVQAQQGDIGTLQTAVAGKQAADADLTAIAALAPADDALIQRKAGAWTSRTPAQVKADMSIGVGDVSGLDENTRDVIGTALVAGSGVAVTVDDPGNTITIAVSGVVADAINDGVTTVAPSQNAVFDALALKVPTTRTVAGLDLSADRTAAALLAALSGQSGADFSLNSHKITNVTDPSSAQDAATKAYVDARASTPIWTLIEERTLGSNSALETFSTLSAYKQFRLTIEGRSTATGAVLDGLLLRMNTDSGSNYSYSRQGWYDTTTDTNTGGSATSSIALGFLAGAQTNTNRRGFVRAEISQKTGGFAVAVADYSLTLSSGNTAYGGRAHGSWLSTTAISSLSVLLASGSIASGAVIRLEGRA